MDKQKHLPFLLFVCAIPALQLLTLATGTEYYLTQLTMSAYYGLIVLGLALLMGYAGQISIGHAAFFALGGYTAAILTTFNLLRFETRGPVLFLKAAGLVSPGLDLYGKPLLLLSPWVSLFLAVTVSAAVAFIIGVPVLKLKGHYLAMATLGFGTIVYRLLLGSDLCGAADGITNVPPFRILPSLIVSGSPAHRVGNYYIAWGLVAFGMILLLNLMDTRVGRALKAIHGNEQAAQAMGVDTARYKLAVFVISAVFAAVAGVFMTHYNAGIGPSEASVMKSVRYLSIVAAGGMGSLWGTLSLSVVLNFLSLRGAFGTLDDAVFGAILILIMLFAPQGLLKRETWKALAVKLKKGKRADDAVS
jgi:branched-chain amino acid transport system permease protein